MSSPLPSPAHIVEAWQPPQTPRTRDATLETWRRQRRPSPVSSLRVDWQLLSGLAIPKPEVGRPQLAPGSPATAWMELLCAVDELRSLTDGDTRSRRAVEQLREVIGLERGALFLWDAGSDLLRGTWGTGATGQTVDEHHVAFQPGAFHREAFFQAVSGAERWLHLRNVPLLAQGSDGTQVVGYGDNYVFPIVRGGRPIGLVVADGALSGQPPSQQQLVLTCVFSSMLAELMSPEVERAGPTQAPSKASVKLSDTIAQAVRLLGRDVSLSRDELARRVGLSGGRLGKLFKAEMGEALSQYRSRLRLERYLKLVDPGGGNLLQAALDAGFGSYAQFYRAFHTHYGCSPKVYLDNGVERAAASAGRT